MQGLINGTQNDDFDSLWRDFESALHDIHNRNASRLSFEELYRTVYRLVLKRKADPLYDKVAAFENEWLSTNVRPQFLTLVDVGVMAETSGSLGTKIERRISGEKFLRGMKTAWEDHLLTMRMTTDVLMYMDKVYTAESRKPSIYVTAMGLFRDSVLLSPIDHGSTNADFKSIYSLLHAILLDQIQMEREGETVDKNLIRSSIQMLDGLYRTNMEDENEKLYLILFEPQYLIESEGFYRSESDALLVTVDAPSYLRHVKRRLEEEEQRCTSVLLPCTSAAIRTVVEETLLRGKLDQVLQLNGSGLDHMFENEKYDDLALVYELAARIDNEKKLLKTALQRRLLAQGKSINEAIQQIVNAINSAKKSAKAEVEGEPQDQKADKKSELNAANQHTKAAIQWVDDILRVKHTFDTVGKNAFQEDRGIAKTITDCFTEFINAMGRCAEYICLFIDYNLKTGLKNKSPDDVDMVLANAITVVRFVSDKDMFETHYKQHLSRRLIQSKSVGIDLEKQMISLLKKEFGSAFTHKMEVMFKDIATSEEMTNSYKRHLADAGGSSQVDISVSVLTSAQWPIGNILNTAKPSRDDDQPRKVALQLPRQVERAREGFENYYLQSHSGRALNWQGSLGTADIKAFYPTLDEGGKPTGNGQGKTYLVNVPTYGMMILEQFEKLQSPGQSISLAELLDMTLIPKDDLIRNLHSLTVAPKTRLLKKLPNTKTFLDSDRFAINERFQSPFLKIKVGLAVAATKVEGEKDQKETREKLNQTRGILIEAAIVRIMKSRQSLAHSQLLVEVIEQVKGRFKPEIPLIKQKIESLIEREYLQREGDVEKPVYQYVA